MATRTRRRNPNFKPSTATAARSKPAPAVTSSRYQPPALVQTYGEPAAEKVVTSFDQYVDLAYGGNAVVFGLMNVDLRLFSEARLCWRDRKDLKLTYEPGGLEKLERPWPNCFTGEMLARMKQDAAIAGNAYIRDCGSRLERLRPDWVTIVSWVTTDDLGHEVREVIGYMFDPSGDPDRSPDWYPVEEVAHWAPIPDPRANWRGMSWFTPALREINADRAMTEHREKFFRSAATPNIIIKYSGKIKPEQKIGLAESIAAKHGGPDKAGGTLVLDEGADPMVVGAKFSDAQFQEVLAATENRMAVAAGVPALLAGLKEGLDAAAWSMYRQAMRAYADMKVRPEWRSACSALSVLVEVPDGYELWYDTRDIAALQESETESAQRMQIVASTLSTLVTTGFTKESSVLAVSSGDETKLVDSGLVSVQLLKPGEDPAEAKADPAEPPAEGDTTPQDSSRALVEALVDVVQRSAATTDRLMGVIERRWNADSFDESRVHRDGGGKFSGGVGGAVANALDKLSLAGRIDLKPGEELVSSRRIRSGQWDVLAAEIDTPAGREVRLGVIDPSDRGKWTAGPDASRSARLAQLDHQMAAMMQSGGAGAADTGEFERLREERDSLAGDSEALNRTTSLTPAQAGRLRSDIEAGITKARAMIARDERPDGGEFASGVVPGGLDGDVDWRLDDAGNGGADDWVMWLAIRPHGEGDDWLPEGDDTASFDASNAKTLLGSLAELSGDATRSQPRFEDLERAWTAEQAKLHPRGPGGKFIRKVGEALASGKSNALDGFNREQLRREARNRGLDIPHGAHIDVIKDALWDHEGATKVSSPKTATGMRKRADELLSNLPSDPQERDRVHTEVGGLILNADRMDTAQRDGAKKDIFDALAKMRANPVGGDREKVDQILAPMSHKELDGVAARFEIPDVKGSKQQKRNRLVQTLVGFRLDQNAILNATNDTGQPPPTREEADQAFARIRQARDAAEKAARDAGFVEPTYPSMFGADEAAKAQAHLARVRTKDLPEQLSAQVAATLDTQARLAPNTAKALRKIGVAKPGSKADVQEFGDSLNTQAVYYPDTAEIVLSPHWLGRSDEIATAVDRARGNWFGPSGEASPLAALAAHEYGHHVAFRFMTPTSAMPEPAAKRLLPVIAKELGAKSVVDGYDMFKPSQGMVSYRSLKDFVEENEKVIAKKVSPYGATRFDEMLAEIWQEYSTMGPKARPHIRRIGDVMAQLAEAAQ